MNCSPPGSSVHRISQATILEWVTISFSSRSSRLRDQTRVSCIDRRILYCWATREAQKVVALNPKNLESTSNNSTSIKGCKEQRINYLDPLLKSRSLLFLGSCSSPTNSSITFLKLMGCKGITHLFLKGKFHPYPHNPPTLSFEGPSLQILLLLTSNFFLLP